MRAAAGLLALALLIAVRGRSIWTGIVLAAATLTKFLPLVVLPAFLRPRDWRLPVAFVATLVVCYLPYISVRLAGAWFPRRTMSPRKASPAATVSFCWNCWERP